MTAGPFPDDTAALYRSPRKVRPSMVLNSTSWMSIAMMLSDYVRMLEEFNNVATDSEDASYLKLWLRISSSKVLRNTLTECVSCTTDY